MLSGVDMPDTSVTLPGRCPACGQSLVLPTEQIVSKFACPRCGEKARGTALLDHSSSASPFTPSSSPPASAGSGGMTLQAFDEESDEVTRMHNPDAETDYSPENASALPATQLNATAARPSLTTSTQPSRPALPRPPVSTGKLSQFSENVEDPTRLHMPLSYEEEDSGSESSGSKPKGSLAPPPRATAAELVAFEEDESPEQQTRIDVPLSYEDEPAAPMLSGARLSAPPLSAPPVSKPARATSPLSTPPPRAGERAAVSPHIVSNSALPPAGPTPPVSIPPQSPIPIPGPYDGSVPPPGRRGMIDGFGQDMLQLSLQIDTWLKRRRTVILAVSAIAAGVAAPLVDTVLASSQEAATVLSSNLMLFVLWLFAFAWTGRRRNDNGHWDSSVVFDRLKTHHKLVWSELALFERLPLASRFLTISELLMPIGVIALATASTISISRTVWGWPDTTAGLFFLRFSGTAFVLMALLARNQSESRQGTSHNPGLDASASATKQFPAILDLERPLPASPGQTNSYVREVVQALSLWQPADWPNIDCYRLAIERHLMTRMPWAALGVRQRAPGTRREDAPDLVINGTVLIRLRRGFDNSVPLAATAQMQTQSKGWGIKPTLLVLFETPMSVLEGASATALAGLHRTHPILILRMSLPDTF